MRIRFAVAVLLAEFLSTGLLTAADGDFDPTFGDAGVTTAQTVLRDYPQALAIDGDGRVVVASLADSGPGTDSYMLVARFTAGGELDPSFDVDGIRTVGISFGGAVSAQPLGLALHPDGRIVVVGQVENAAGTITAGAIVRLLPNGDPDPSLDGDGILVLSPAGENYRFRDVAVLEGDVLLVSGDYWTTGDALLAVLQFPPGGAPTGWAVDVFPSADDRAERLLVEPGGRWVVAARAFGIDEVVVTRWAGGALDPTFGGDGIGHYPQPVPVTAIDVDRTEEGRYVLGVGTGTGASSSLELVWLLGDGSVDPATCGTFPFCTFLGFGDFAALAVQSDGRVLALGSSHASEDARLGRFLETGTYDLTFGANGAREFDCTPGAPEWFDYTMDVELSGGKAVGLGRNSLNADADTICVARLTSELVFRSGFEGADFWGWSATAD